MVYMANTSTKFVPFIKTRVYKELIYRTKTARKHWIEGRENFERSRRPDPPHLRLHLHLFRSKNNNNTIK